MKTKMFAVYDAKAKMFAVPFFMQTLGMALRAFQDITGDPNTMIARHPEDFTLYEIGEYDDSTAEVVAKNPMQMIAVASEFKTARIQSLSPAPLAAADLPEKSHLQKALENQNSKNKMEVNK